MLLASACFVRKLIKKRVYSCQHYGKPCLAVDVSIIFQRDAGTGIQRVVNNVVKVLSESVIVDYKVRFVAAGRSSPYMFVDFDGFSFRPTDELVELGKGDAFLGLDFCSAILPANWLQIRRWKKVGTRICVLVYDLLPLTNPEWFTKKSVNAYLGWFKFIQRYSDHVICISEDVKKNFLKIGNIRTRKIRVDRVRLSGNLSGAERRSGITSSHVVPSIDWGNYLLMVGTIEPRKGYDSALDIYFQLSEKIRSVPQLIVVGRQGWKSTVIKKRLRDAAAGNKVVWLENVSDAVLNHLYIGSKGVFITSLAEGFGLPLAEAIHFKKSVFARRLNVFEEISDKNVTFFDGEVVSDIASKMADWLRGLYSINSLADKHDDVDNNWQRCTAQLVHYCVGKQLLNCKDLEEK